jgi:hypothetical protein
MALQAKPVLQGNHRSTPWHMLCKDGSPHNEERDEVSKTIGEDVKEHEETNSASNEPVVASEFLIVSRLSTRKSESR